MTCQVNCEKESNKMPFNVEMPFNYGKVRPAKIEMVKPGPNHRHLNPVQSGSIRLIAVKRPTLLSPAHLRQICV